jgi:hypothetical protein
MEKTMSFQVVLLFGNEPVAFGSADELPDVTTDIQGPGRLPPVSFTVTIIFHQNGLKVLGEPSNLGDTLGSRAFTCEFADSDGNLVRRANNCAHNVTDPSILAKPADACAVIDFLATDVSGE